MVLFLSLTSFAPRHLKTLWTLCGMRLWSTTASLMRKCHAKLFGKNNLNLPPLTVYCTSFIKVQGWKHTVVCLQTFSERWGQVWTQWIHWRDTSCPEETEVWPEEELQCLFRTSDPSKPENRSDCTVKHSIFNLRVNQNVGNYFKLIHIWYNWKGQNSYEMDHEIRQMYLNDFIIPIGIIEKLYPFGIWWTDPWYKFLWGNSLTFLRNAIIQFDEKIDPTLMSGC